MGRCSQTAVEPQRASLEDRLKSQQWVHDAILQSAQAAAVCAGRRDGQGADLHASATRTLAEAFEILRRTV